MGSGSLSALDEQVPEEGVGFICRIMEIDAHSFCAPLSTSLSLYFGSLRQRMGPLKILVSVASFSLIALVVVGVVDTAAPVDSVRSTLWVVVAGSGVPVFLAMLWHCVSTAPPSRKLFRCTLLLIGGVPAAILYYWLVVRKPVSARAPQ